MTSTLPAYYSSAKPFRNMFQQGVPILTYHKIGPRPARARLKGLYVSVRLYRAQLAELRQAGYTSTSLGAGPGGMNPSARNVVLTFDDGFRNVWRHALEPLAQNRFCAIQFLVADRLGQENEWEQREGEVKEELMDAGQVRDWLAAGHDIGSHTLNHPYLTRLSLHTAREEISASKKKLEDLFGVVIHHFCYPYGDWNPAVRDLVMDAGYRTACTTDFGVNTPETPPFSLKRITARYPSRNLKAFKVRLANLLSCLSERAAISKRH